MDSVSVRGLSANPIVGKTAEHEEEASREAQAQGGIAPWDECLPAGIVKGVATGVSAPKHCSRRSDQQAGETAVALWPLRLAACYMLPRKPMTYCRRKLAAARKFLYIEAMWCLLSCENHLSGVCWELPKISKGVGTSHRTPLRLLALHHSVEVLQLATANTVTQIVWQKWMSHLHCTHNAGYPICTRVNLPKSGTKRVTDGLPLYGIHLGGTCVLWPGMANQLLLVLEELICWTGYTVTRPTVPIVPSCFFCNHDSINVCPCSNDSSAV